MSPTIQVILATNDDISMRVLELRTTRSNEVVAGTILRDVTDRNRRIEEWQARWEELREAIDGIVVERGEDMAEVPGGSTGFLCRDYKGLGMVEVDADPVEDGGTGTREKVREFIAVYKIDGGPYDIATARPKSWWRRFLRIRIMS
jgi:hypothetical protein